MRNTMRKWMVGTALAVGLIGTGAMTANAAPHDFHIAAYRGYERPFVREYARPGFGVVVGAPVPVGPVVGGYIPPCPGDGYIWIGGRWVFHGYRAYGPRYYGPGRFEAGRGFYRR